MRLSCRRSGISYEVVFPALIRERSSVVRGLEQPDPVLGRPPVLAEPAEQDGHFVLR